jgi:hypothetical protein
LLSSQGELFNALDADLSTFRASGGKMIMWHGLSDSLVLPGQSQRYFGSVQDKLGNHETYSFFRLFMAPGLGHCWALPAETPDQMDLLSALERWVEQDIAPDEIAVTQLNSDGAVLRRGMLHPYPQVATYSETQGEQ